MPVHRLCIALALATILLFPFISRGQDTDAKVLKELLDIEQVLYQDPVAAKFRLQRLATDHADAHDSTRSLIYLKWGTSLGMTNNLDSAIWATQMAKRLAPSDKIEKASTLQILAVLYRLKGKYDLAEEAIQESLRLNDSIWKNPMHHAFALQEYGGLCLDQFKYAQATNLFLQALDTMLSPRFKDARKPMLVAKLRINLAEAYQRSGNLDMAIREFELARPTLDSMGDLEGFVRTGESLANAYIDNKAFNRADSLLNALLPLSEKLQNDELKAYLLLGKANSLAKRGQHASALPFFRRSFALFDANGSALILNCVTPFLETLLRSGGEAEARQVMDASSVQTAVANALPVDLLKYRRAAIGFLWKDMTAAQLQVYYRDLLALSDSVRLEEKRQSALEAQAKYQFERQKEFEQHLLTENALLKEREQTKRYLLFLAIALGVVTSLLLALIIRRMMQRARIQTEALVTQQKEIAYHKDRREWAEREKDFREQLIRQQKETLAKSIAEAERLQEQLQSLVQEQQQTRRQEMLEQFESSRTDQQGIEVLITQFNALYPTFASSLLRQYPKLSQADVQFCSLVRMNLTTKEISVLLNIEPRSIYVKKYRLLEKMGLGEGDDFEQLLYALS